MFERISKSARAALRAAKVRWSAFRDATSGNVAMMYGLALVPTIAAAGVAVDMNQAVAVRTRLGQALDAAGLSVAATPGLTAQQIQERAQQFFDANFPDDALGDALSLSASQTGDIVRLTAAARVETAFLGLIGIEYIEVGPEAEVVRESRGLEIALSLDNTGSMGNAGKLAALKSATTDMINILFGDNAAPEKLRMGLIPFSETVRLDTTSALLNGWIDTNGLSLWARAHFNNGRHPLSVWSTMRNSSWGGCVEARPNGLEELDTPPTASNPNTLWVPFFQPDEPDNGGYGNNYLSDGVGGTPEQRLMNSAKYVNRQSTRPNSDCSMQRILPLTNNKATLLSYVNGMQATGYTHIAIGAAWGWRVLSPEAPFTEGSQYGDEEWNKALVLMTDGVNTIPARNSYYGSDYTAYGYLRQARLGTQSAPQATSRQNDLTELVCQRMKDRGIRIYSILLMEDNVATRDMMEACASTPELFFDTPTTGELSATFTAIANDLSNLRISK
jgi:Flp pilus assembly protein TadG